MYSAPVKQVLLCRVCVEYVNYIETTFADVINVYNFYFDNFKQQKRQ